MILEGRVGITDQRLIGKFRSCTKSFRLTVFVCQVLYDRRARFPGEVMQSSSNSFGVKVWLYLILEVAWRRVWSCFGLLDCNEYEKQEGKEIRRTLFGMC